MCLSCNIYGTVNSPLFAEILGVPPGAVVSLSDLSNPIILDKGKLFEDHEERLMALLSADERVEYLGIVEENAERFPKDPAYQRVNAFYRAFRDMRSQDTPLWTLIDATASGLVTDPRGVMPPVTATSSCGVDYWACPGAPVRYREGTEIGGVFKPITVSYNNLSASSQSLCAAS